MNDLFTFAETVAKSQSDVEEQQTERPTRPDLFGEEPELPPTWSEDSEVFHTAGSCNRLKAIRRNKRITGKPGVKMRLCFNCEDIIRTKRAG